MLRQAKADEIQSVNVGCQQENVRDNDSGHQLRTAEQEGRSVLVINKQLVGRGGKCITHYVASKSVGGLPLCCVCPCVVSALCCVCTVLCLPLCRVCPCVVSAPVLCLHCVVSALCCVCPCVVSALCCVCPCVVSALCCVCTVLCLPLCCVCTVLCLPRVVSALCCVCTVLCLPHSCQTHRGASEAEKVLQNQSHYEQNEDEERVEDIGCSDVAWLCEVTCLLPEPPPTNLQGKKRTIEEEERREGRREKCG